MTTTRRRFLQLLGIAPVVAAEVFDPHRVIFDMGRSLVWTPPPVEIVAVGPTVQLLDQLNAITQQYIDKAIVDVFYAPSPAYEAIMRNRKLLGPEDDPAYRRLHGLPPQRA